MSTIFGVVDSHEVPRDLIERMAVTQGELSGDHIVHRGTMAFGIKGDTYSSGRVDGYGCTPDQQIHVVFSGEITNRTDIIAAEPDHLRATTGNAEIVAVLFQQQSTRCMKRLNGQFCAAIWDATRTRLHLLLDRVGGIKNLYYACSDTGFAFGSRLASLLVVPGIRRELDISALIDLFATGYILPPTSLMSNIRKMRPGEEVVYEKGQLSTRIIDRIDFSSRKEPADEAAALGQMEEKLVSSLNRLTLDHASESCFLLSGGIDSSLLVALAAQRLGRTVRTFSASFPGSDLDESKYAGIIASANQCEHHQVNLAERHLLDNLPEIVWYLDEPFLDYSAIPTYHLFKAVRSFTPVVVGGDGPDHLFGRYYPLAAKRHCANRVGPAVRLLAAMPVAFIQKIARVSGCSIPEAYRELFVVPNWGLDHTSTMLSLFTPEVLRFDSRIPYFAPPSQFKESLFTEVFDSVCTVDFYVDGSFGVFSKVGKMAEAHGLVVQEPYLDREVADFIASLPISQKVRGTKLDFLLSRADSKYLLKNRLAPQVLPLEIINRKKGGFTPPLEGWLRETVCSIPVERIFCRSILTGGVFNIDCIKRILAEHGRGQRDWSTIIFMLLCVDLWTRMFIESNCETPPRWTLEQVYQ